MQQSNDFQTGFYRAFAELGIWQRASKILFKSLILSHLYFCIEKRNRSRGKLSAKRNTPISK
jgi:hypothetical protein